MGGIGTMILNFDLYRPISYLKAGFRSFEHFLKSRQNKSGNIFLSQVEGEAYFAKLREKSYIPMLKVEGGGGTCSSCDECVQLCPSGALTLGPKKFMLNLKKCIACSECIENCPEQALEGVHYSEWNRLLFQEKQYEIDLKKRRKNNE
jgi:ferredoxin